MGTILDQIAAYTRKRVEQEEKACPRDEMIAQAKAMGPGTGKAFMQALARPGLSLICEVKKASPSRGVISESFPYLEIAQDYALSGAAAISCLTEPNWFLGSDGIFRAIRREVKIPMLRKDFTVSDYQLYQARTLGADAVLLIVALHDRETLRRRLALCQELGLAALTEAHDAVEIQTALEAGAEIIGVNNRNLKDFSVDIGQAARLRDRIPSEVTYVAESGVSGPEDLKMLKAIGADAVLMGEVLMRAPDRRGTLEEMRKEAET